MLNGETVQIGSVDIDLRGALSGYGTVAGQLINGGIVEAKGGTLTFESQVDFGPSLAASGLVELATPIAFEGVIAGFGSSDVINLINTPETIQLQQQRADRHEWRANSSRSKFLRNLISIGLHARSRWPRWHLHYLCVGRIRIWKSQIPFVPSAHLLSRRPALQQIP
jgi:hypothetical protein